MEAKEYLELTDRTCKHVGEDGYVIDEFTYDLLHASLGMSGEAGEFLDAVKKKFIYNKEFDTVNAKEELGDILWYVALAMRALGVSFEEIMQMNIDKLKLRYPDKYTNEAAILRADKQ